MKKKVIRWAYGLIGGCIGGGAGAVGAWLGISAAKQAGIDVPSLNWNSMKILFISGVVTHAVAYLTKSPLPELTISSDTDPPFPKE